MRLISFIVLLLWTVCYGRCLKELYGADETATQQGCEHQCCQHEKPDAPPNEPGSPCGVCDFIKSGIILPSDAHLDVPVFHCLVIWEQIWLSERAFELLEEEKQNAVVTDTGPPFVPRMCEWMARTAAPVRGPNTLG